MRRSAKLVLYTRAHAETEEKNGAADSRGGGGGGESRRLAVFALILAAIGALLIRSAAIEVTAGLSVFGAAILLACVSLLLAAAGMTVIWRAGRRGMSYVVTGVFLSLALLAYPVQPHLPIAARAPPAKSMTLQTEGTTGPFSRCSRKRCRGVPAGTPDADY